MEDDLEWLGVSSEHDQIGYATVERLGRLVGSFLQLVQRLGLVDEVQDSLAHLVVCFRPRSALLDGIIILWRLLRHLDLLGDSWLVIGIRGLGLLLLLLLLLFLVLFVLLAFLVFLGRLL